MRAASSVTVTRKCRFCGCTPEKPCVTPFGDECSFLGAKADRCSSDACVLAFDRERDEERVRDAVRRRASKAVRPRPRKRKGSAR